LKKLEANLYSPRGIAITDAFRKNAFYQTVEAFYPSVAYHCWSVGFNCALGADLLKPPQPCHKTRLKSAHPMQDFTNALVIDVKHQNRCKPYQKNIALDNLRIS
jgi:methionine synthase I (cobalamin-dependent)